MCLLDVKIVSLKIVQLTESLDRVIKSELLVWPFQPVLTSWFHLVLMLKYFF
ncbi:hypothetical protein AAZX31_12G162800 [Glycine max]